ncbi:MAG: hypothetical protein HY334_08540 [Armatimonadetes bacterium]|nr:hypothetical protein [Armatimonadota bacterium]
MGEIDQAVRQQVSRHGIDTGRPPTAGDTAVALGSPSADVEAAYRRLAEGRALVLTPGTLEIRMANPLSAVPTAFGVEVGGRSWWGNCVWDALGIPAMFGADGRIVTACGDCGEPMTLRVERGALRPAAGLIHFAIPAARWWDDIIFT